jgi:HEAT repeat protein
VPNRLPPCLLLMLTLSAPLFAQDIEARFTTEKLIYLSGEPVFVVLSVSNKGSAPVWVDFGRPDLYCTNFAIEVPGAESAREQWGCGIGGSCGRSLREVPAGKRISVRRLVNEEFRLQRPGAYAVQAHTTISVRAHDLWDSAPIEQMTLSDAMNIGVQQGDEEQLKAVFQPIVAELDSPDLVRRGEAAEAVTELAPPFLEDILIGLTKTGYAFGAISALRKADTVKTRDALERIAISGDNSMLRIEAIRNLGRTDDETYVPSLLRLLNSPEIQIQGAAAEAVGNLAGAAAVKDLVVLVSSPDSQTRQAGANGLQYTHARQAVPVLIELLLDSDMNLRRTALNGLAVLTHRVALDGNDWADVTSPQSSASVHQRWLSWWNFHGNTSDIYGMRECARFEPLA